MVGLPPKSATIHSVPPEAAKDDGRSVGFTTSRPVVAHTPLPTACSFFTAGTVDMYATVECTESVMMVMCSGQSLLAYSDCV